MNTPQNSKEIKRFSLYKFTTVDILLKILQPGGGFRFSAVEELNDAFESIDIKNPSLRTLSFSRCHSQLLMWAHYCNKYMGCSIKLDKEKYTNISAFEEVKYRPRNVRINAVDDKKKLTIKGKQWAYEKEHRIIIDTEKDLPPDIFLGGSGEGSGFYFLRPYIKQIAFGCNVQDSQGYLEVLRRIKDLNDKAVKNKRKGRDYIEVKKYAISKNNFALEEVSSYNYEQEIVRLEARLKLAEI